MSNWIPRLRDYRNELVVWLGIIASTLLAIQEILGDWEPGDLSSWFFAVPAVLSIIQRQFAYGMKTVERDYTKVA